MLRPVVRLSEDGLLHCCADVVTVTPGHTHMVNVNGRRVNCRCGERAAGLSGTL